MFITGRHGIKRHGANVRRRSSLPDEKGHDPVRALPGQLGLQLHVATRFGITADDQPQGRSGSDECRDDSRQTRLLLSGQRRAAGTKLNELATDQIAHTLEHVFRQLRLDPAAGEMVDGWVPGQVHLHLRPLGDRPEITQPQAFQSARRVGLQTRVFSRADAEITRGWRAIKTG